MAFVTQTQQRAKPRGHTWGSDWRSPFDPSWDASISNGSIYGFINKSAECYRNAVIQQLLHLPVFVHWLQFCKKNHIPVGATCIYGGNKGPCKLCKLHDLAVVYWKIEDGNYQNLFNACWVDIFKDWGHVGQQDTSEFWPALYDQMVAATRDLYRRDLADIFRLRTCDIRNCHGKGACLGAVYVNNEESFFTIQCDRENTDATLNIVDAMGHYFDSTLVQDSKCVKCGKEQFVSTRLNHPPEVLFVKLNRIYWTKEGAMKSSQKITFSRSLNLPSQGFNPSLAEARVPIEYQLSSVQLHRGKTTVSGHYLAAVRGSRGEWTLCDDKYMVPYESFEKMAESKDVQQTSYIFAYRRCPLGPEKENPIAQAQVINQNIAQLDDRIQNLQDLLTEDERVTKITVIAEFPAGTTPEFIKSFREKAKGGPILGATIMSEREASVFVEFYYPDEALAKKAVKRCHNMKVLGKKLSFKLESSKARALRSTADIAMQYAVQLSVEITINSRRRLTITPERPYQFPKSTSRVGDPLSMSTGMEHGPYSRSASSINSSSDPSSSDGPSNSDTSSSGSGGTSTNRPVHQIEENAKLKLLRSEVDAVIKLRQPVTSQQWARIAIFLKKVHEDLKNRIAQKLKDVDEAMAILRTVESVVQAERPPEESSLYRATELLEAGRTKKTVLLFQASQAIQSAYLTMMKRLRELHEPDDAMKVNVSPEVDLKDLRYRASKFAWLILKNMGLLPLEGFSYPSPDTDNSVNEILTEAEALYPHPTRGAMTFNGKIQVIKASAETEGEKDTWTADEIHLAIDAVLNLYEDGGLVMGVGEEDELTAGEANLADAFATALARLEAAVEALPDSEAVVPAGFLRAGKLIVALAKEAQRISDREKTRELYGTEEGREGRLTVAYMTDDAVKILDAAVIGISIEQDPESVQIVDELTLPPQLYMDEGLMEISYEWDDDLTMLASMQGRLMNKIQHLKEAAAVTDDPPLPKTARTVRKKADSRRKSNLAATQAKSKAIEDALNKALEGRTPLNKEKPKEQPKETTMEIVVPASLTPDVEMTDAPKEARPKKTAIIERAVTTRVVRQRALPNAAPKGEPKAAPKKAPKKTPKAAPKAANEAKGMNLKERVAASVAKKNQKPESKRPKEVKKPKAPKKVTLKDAAKPAGIKKTKAKLKRKKK